MAQMEEIKIVVSRVNSENVDSDFFDFISFSKTSVSFKMHGNVVKCISATWRRFCKYA